MNSLERSLQFGLTVSVVLILSLFWWAGTLGSRLLAETHVLQRLAGEATDLAGSLDVHRLHRSLVDGGPVGGAVVVPDRGDRWYRVQFDDDRIYRSSPSADVGLLPVLVPGASARRQLAAPDGAPQLVWLGGFRRDGIPFTLAVGEDVRGLHARLEAFRWFVAAVAGSLLAGLLLVQRLIVRRSLVRLDAIRDDIRRLERGQQMALSEDVPGEIAPLVREFNRLLQRSDQRLRQSRNAVGNLAHALKGPLNLLMERGESAQVRQHAERIHQLIDGELRRARLAGRSGAGQLFDLDAELPALSGLLQQVYADKAIDVRLNVGPDVELLFDRQDMLELIGNLLDNAVKWARSVVMINFRAADGVLIEVEDDGPGCSPAELRLMTQRGVRLDESVTGHGLGLSIVKDIVDIYQGSLSFGTSSRLGGLRASVHLPDTVPGGS